MFSNFRVCNALRTNVGLDAGLDGKTRPRSISILANQILEFGCFQTF